ncbi:hypothetical protein [Roseicyclus sp.]|uniref:hypothetical protein n=1 Tax=Roseicyclus sp. TaxID=1914329 RepID=UPI001BCAAD6D|nr:hypothetical protein [Roseicyclus sp.]
MAIRKPLALIVAATIAMAAPMAHAGDRTVPNTPSVFSPAFPTVPASIYLTPSFSTIIGAALSGTPTTVTLTGGTVVNVNPNGSITVTLPGGATNTFSSGFVASFFSGYLS